MNLWNVRPAMTVDARRLTRTLRHEYFENSIDSIVRYGTERLEYRVV